MHVAYCVANCAYTLKKCWRNDLSHAYQPGIDELRNACVLLTGCPAQSLNKCLTLGHLFQGLACPNLCLICPILTRCSTTFQQLRSGHNSAHLSVTCHCSNFNFRKRVTKMSRSAFACSFHATNKACSAFYSSTRSGTAGAAPEYPSASLNCSSNPRPSTIVDYDSSGSLLNNRRRLMSFCRQCRLHSMMQNTSSALSGASNPHY